MKTNWYDASLKELVAEFIRQKTALAEMARLQAKAATDQAAAWRRNGTSEESIARRERIAAWEARRAEIAEAEVRAAMAVSVSDAEALPPFPGY